MSRPSGDPTPRPAPDPIPPAPVAPQWGAAIGGSAFSPGTTSEPYLPGHRYPASSEPRTPLRLSSLGDLIEAGFVIVARMPLICLGASVIVTGSLLVAGVVLATAATVINTGTFDPLYLLHICSDTVALATVASLASSVLAGPLAVVADAAAAGRSIDLAEWRGVLRRRWQAALLVSVGVWAITAIPGIVIQTLVATALARPSIVALFAVIAGLLIAIPFGWLAVRLSIAPPAAVLDGTGVGGAMRRSWALTAGSFWRCLLVLFTVWVATEMIGVILRNGLPLLAPRSFIESVPGMLTGIIIAIVLAVILSPLPALARGVLFVDTRIRREGLDLGGPGTSIAGRLP